VDRRALDSRREHDIRGRAAFRAAREALGRHEKLSLAGESFDAAREAHGRREKLTGAVRGLRAAREAYRPRESFSFAREPQSNE
jgi:hypothetical protein